MLVGQRPRLLGLQVGFALYGWFAVDAVTCCLMVCSLERKESRWRQQHEDFIKAVREAKKLSTSLSVWQLFLIC